MGAGPTLSRDGQVTCTCPQATRLSATEEQLEDCSRRLSEAAVLAQQKEEVGQGRSGEEGREGMGRRNRTVYNS